MKKTVTVRKRLAQGLAISGIVALASGWARQRVEAQVPQLAQVPREAGAIESLSVPGQRLLIRNVSKKTGLVAFAGSRDGIELPLQASVTAEERALSFVDLYGRPFGLADRSQLQRLEAPRTDEIGLTHARFQQVHNGIPIRAAEFFVHMKGTRVMSANGLVIDDLPDDVVPAVAPAAAVEAARAIVEKYRPSDARGARYLAPRLEIFNKGVFEDGTHRSRLAWFVEAANSALREYIWIDAQTGARLLSFSQLSHALVRRVHDMAGSNNEAALPGTLRRSESQDPSGDADVDNAYLFSGSAFQYFFSTHGRHSFNAGGAAIISSVHYGVAYENAFWNGTQFVYGDGLPSADDIVGHEFTHALTDYTAHLLNYYQSGAMSESIADAFGETIDQTDGVGDDAAGVRWLIGENLPPAIGARRNMMDPNAFGHPGKMSDSAQFSCVSDGWTNPNGDRGGIHINNGIPNHAYALLVDGGSFNGRTVAGIGLLKAGKIWYRALLNYLTSGAGFVESYAAINEACSDLIGTAGITEGDCTQATIAMQAVEMNTTWACAGAVPAPDLCASGTPVISYFDGFDNALGNWWVDVESGSGGSWGLESWFSRRGTELGHGAFYGSDPATTSVHNLFMTESRAVPAGGRVYFDSAFEFESSNAFFDGGVLQYSINGGSSWNDAGSLIDAGRNYNGTLDATNPLGAVPAFVGTTFGYTGTRLNLASLAGQNVRLRFRIGTDDSVASFGWFVDSVTFYTCTVDVAPAITVHPANLARKAGTVASFSASASGTPAPTVQWQVSTDGTNWSNIGGATSTTYSLTVTAADHGKRFRAVFTNSVNSATTNAALLSVRSVSGSDFNGDAATDLAVFRPSTGQWFVRNQLNLQFGEPGDIPVPGDYNKDGTTDLAVFRPSTGQWFVRNQFDLQFGNPGDIPVPADYNGDGTTDIAVYRPLTGQWLVRNQFTIQFGGAGHIPIAGDFNGDGSDDVAVFQPKTGTWSVRNQFTLQYGEAGDVPVPNDYNGDGSDDVAVYRQGTGQWLVRNQFVVSYGSPGDRPMPRDYNGDGTADIAVYRRATGQWFVRNQFIIQFGEPVDTPAPRGPSLARAVGGDFDGNGNTDVSVYRPSTGQWFVRNRFTLQFGDPADKAVPADYDGDGVIDVAVYRPSTGQWFARNQFAVQFGDPTDLPVPGDYNGDGVHDVAVFRPSTGTWYVRNVLAFQFGDNGDIPVPGDYNGDGIADLAVYRPSTQQWFVRGILALQFGDPGDVPVPGDYNGDGVMDVAVYRPSTGQWFVRNILAVQFGDPTDTPVPGDYDGDGRMDLAVFRPSTGQWFVRNLLAVQFGDPTDTPVVRIGGSQ